MSHEKFLDVLQVSGVKDQVPTIMILVPILPTVLCFQSPFPVASFAFNYTFRILRLADFERDLMASAVESLACGALSRLCVREFDWVALFPCVSDSVKGFVATSA